MRFLRCALALALVLSPASAAELKGRAQPPAKPGAVAEFRFALDRLPTDGPDAERIVESLRADLDPRTGPGVALVDTTPWLKPELLERFAAELPEGAKQLWLDKDPAQVIRSGFDGENHGFLPAEQRAALLQYADWLAWALNESLGPREKVEPTQRDVRIGLEQGFEGFHPDGGYLGAMLALRDRNTRYFRDGNPSLPPRYRFDKSFGPKYDAIKEAMNRRTDFLDPPPGHALVISADERALRFPGKVRQTWHARPPLSPDRTLYIMRFSSVGGK